MLPMESAGVLALSLIDRVWSRHPAEEHGTKYNVLCNLTLAAHLSATPFRSVAIPREAVVLRPGVTRCECLRTTLLSVVDSNMAR